MKLTLNGKAKSVSGNAFGSSLSVRCDEFKRLHSEKRRVFIVKKLRIKLEEMGTRFLHRPVTTAKVEFAS